MGCVILKDRVFRTHLTRMHCCRDAHVLARVMLSVGSTDGIESPWNCTVRAKKVNAWVCALATDRDLESVLSKSISVRTRKMVNDTW